MTPSLSIGMSTTLNLSEYLGILKTPAYQKFNHTLNQALVATLLSRTEQVMHEVSTGKAASKSGSRQ